MKVKNAMGNEYSGTLEKKVTAVRRKGVNFLRNHVVPYDPKTQLQMKQRQKFADAYEEWKRLTPEEREQYNELARDSKMSGYNLFVSEFAIKRR